METASYGYVLAVLPSSAFYSSLPMLARLQAEMQRLLTHSSQGPGRGLARGFLCRHLRKRGSPTRAIDSTFRSIKWKQRNKMREPRKRADDKLLVRYRACVFSNRHAPGSANGHGLRTGMVCERAWTSRDSELRQAGLGRDMLLSHALFALRSALPMGHILPG